jgi:methyl-accepting chemotaxis protein
MWTFGKKLAAGFSIPVITLVLVGFVTHRTTDSLTTTSTWVAHTHKVLERIARLELLMTQAETASRGFGLTGDEVFLEPYRAALPNVESAFAELQGLTDDNPAQQRNLAELKPLMSAKLEWLKRLVDVRRAQGLEEASKTAATRQGDELMVALRKLWDRMEETERQLLDKRSADAEQSASSAKATIISGTLGCFLIALLVGYSLTRSLTTQIGSAVRHVQSSTTELQAAANQQVMGSKEQTTAMNEISTTINELLATSRQIAESAQRVAQIASEAGGSARRGDQTVQKAQESVFGIRRQVDVIVGHMLDLGKKSQQIGSVLEIINELSEQTNILAINATIEAAGAGDGGKRFAAVADEIRKLADRVGGSTKEIRGLVDDIRAAVNTTVMATEVGSKAVEAGTAQFAEVATSFKQIAGQVLTTNEAAREIELSTKQQSTAVGQVNIAVANVSQAARETEASSNQTLQTASELTKLSLDLARMIQPDAA